MRLLASAGCMYLRMSGIKDMYVSWRPAGLNRDGTLPSGCRIATSGGLARRHLSLALDREEREALLLLAPRHSRSWDPALSPAGKLSGTLRDWLLE